MSALHTAELMDPLQFAWPPYAVQPLELDRQLQMYCDENRMSLSAQYRAYTCFILLQAKQL